MWDNYNRPTYIRRGIIALLILITAMAQNTVGGLPAFFGAHVNLIIPLIVATAMFERGIAGLGFGLFAGVLLDTCATNSDGFYSFVIMATGFVCGTMITYYLRNNIVTAFVLCLISSVLCNTLYWLCFIVFRGIDSAGYIYLRYYLPSVVCTVIFTPLYYHIIRKLSERIKNEHRTFTF